jgi:lipid II:glycine glycyltransferase (peptidoglycan interpeptide bridge formation enzyme)
MDIRLLTSAEDFATYDRWVKAHPQANMWQSSGRMKYIATRGKKAAIYIIENASDWKASALVVIDRTKGNISTWEIPRGPLWTEEKAAQDLVSYIVAEAKKQGAMSLYLSPILPLPLLDKGWGLSKRHVHAEATRILDISESEEHILAQMHQKGRYNIKVAQKNAVIVEQSIDIHSFAKLSKETSARDKFIAASGKQYESFLLHQPGSFLLLAYSTKNSKPIAGLLGVTYEHTGIYYYGASDHEQRALMAPYLLQWEAIKLCKNLGCTHYDLLGIAPINAPGNHPWLGISDFKAKFGGSVVTYPPEQEMVLRPVMKRLLKLKRRIVG